MNERNFQIEFQKWVKRYFPYPAVFELKVCDKYFYMRNLRPHQYRALKAAKHGHFTYKIPDDSIGFKPFDVVSFTYLSAFLVVRYNQSGRHYLFDIDTVECIPYSMNEQQAMEWADYTWEYMT